MEWVFTEFLHATDALAQIAMKILSGPEAFQARKIAMDSWKQLQKTRLN